MNQSFEDEFKEITGNHEEIVDINSLWNNVESVIVKDKKKKQGFWIFFSVGIITALSLSMFYWNNETVENTSQVVSIINPKKQNKAVLTNVLSEKGIHEKAENEIHVQNNSIVANQAEIEVLENAVSPDRNPIKNVISSFSNPDLVSKNSTGIILEKETRNSETKSTAKKLNTIKNLKDSKVENQAISILKQRDEQSGSLLEKLRIFGIEHQSDNEGITLVKKIHKVSKKITNKSFRISSGISFGNQNYQGQITDDFYRTMERYDFSFEIRLKSYRNWSLWTGVNYGQFIDEFSWEGQYRVKKIEEYVSDKTYLIGMQVQEIYSNGEIEYIIDQKFLKYNSRSILSIPIKLQYAKRINRWDLEVYASMLLNYQFANEYYYIDNNGAPQIESSNMKFITPSYIFGANIGYRITQNKMLLTGLYLQRIKHGFENDIEKQVFRDSRLGILIGFQYNY